MIGLVWQSAIVVHFYANRAEIAAEHCVNKKVTESNCEGSCHLKKQLQPTVAANTTIPAEELLHHTGLLTFSFYSEAAPIKIASPYFSTAVNTNLSVEKTARFCGTIFQPPQAC